MRRFLKIASLFTLSTLGVIGCMEMLNRRYFGLDAPPASRYSEPYLHVGEGVVSVTEKQLLEPLEEGPSRYGYRVSNETYLYRPDPAHPVRKMDRADFLFRKAYSRHSPRQLEVLDKSAKKIFVVGGSVAQGGVATDFDKTWHFQVEEKLRKASRNSNIHVINAAMGAYISTQERLALELAVFPHRPQMVIILDGYNDVATPLRTGSRPGDPYNAGPWYYENYRYSPLKPLLKVSSLYRYWRFQSVARVIDENAKAILADPALRETLKQEIANVYMDNVEAMLARCQSQSIPAYVFLQPFRSLALKERARAIASQEDDFQFSVVEEIRKRIAASPFKKQFFDLTRIYDSYNPLDLFNDPVHPNDQGHAILAQAVYDRLPH